MVQRVFVDANVLFSKTLMDWLHFPRFENPGMFQLFSSEDVFVEVLANMRKRWPQARGEMTIHRAKLMRTVMDDVLPGFPGGIPFTGTDPHDYHVHAGAIAARADYVLTCNSPSDLTTTPDLETYEITHPDDFFILVGESNPASLAPIVQAQMSYWARHSENRQLDAALIRAGCPKFAERIRQVLRDFA